MFIFTNETTKHLERGLLKGRNRAGSWVQSKFPGGEWRYQIKSSIKGKHVTLVASVLEEPETFFELLSLGQALHDQKPKKLTLVIPYFAYGRQDRVIGEDGALGVRFAGAIGQLPVSKIVCVDLHSKEIRKAFGAKLEELSMMEVIAKACCDSVDIVVAPDKGRLDQAGVVAANLKVGVGYILKTRSKTGAVTAEKLFGDVQDKNVLIIDDMIDTGKTIVAAKRLLTKLGARSCSVGITHGIFSGAAFKKIMSSGVLSVTTTNSRKQSRQKKLIVIDITTTIL